MAKVRLEERKANSFQMIAFRQQDTNENIYLINDTEGGVRGGGGVSSGHSAYK